MSYSNEIENRAIYNAWGYSRDVGRMRIQGISGEYNRIGTVVSWKASTNNDTNWVLKTFIDGTAYFYPQELSKFNYTTSQSIKDVIYKHYRVVKEENLQGDQGYGVMWYRRKLQVLRHKPVGDLSKKHFVKTTSFGEYLAKKYNTLQMGEPIDA